MPSSPEEQKAWGWTGKDPVADPTPPQYRQMTPQEAATLLAVQQRPPVVPVSAAPTKRTLWGEFWGELNQAGPDIAQILGRAARVGLAQETLKAFLPPEPQPAQPAEQPPPQASPKRSHLSLTDRIRQGIHRRGQFIPEAPPPANQTRSIVVHDGQVVDTPGWRILGPDE